MVCGAADAGCFPNARLEATTDARGYLPNPLLPDAAE